MSGTHPHRHGADAGGRHVAAVLALVCTFLAAELTVAVISHSLALLADAGHMVADGISLVGALWAIRLARRPVSRRWSYGLKRGEVVSAAVNGVSLAVIGAAVTIGAVQRLLHPVGVAGFEVLWVALAGLGVNATSSWLLLREDRTSINVKGVFQHVRADAGGFGATVVAAVLIIATGFRQADSIASLLVVALMARTSWGLLRESGRVLLEGTPEGIDLEEVRRRLLGADEHVLGVHDVHAWEVTTSLPAISAHVVVEESCFGDGHAPKLLDQLQDALIGSFDVEHSTIQLEAPPHSGHEVGAH